MSKTLKKRGFRFVGSTICYAFMQATGMVDDHLVSCFRHKESRDAEHRRDLAPRRREKDEFERLSDRVWGMPELVLHRIPLLRRTYCDAGAQGFRVTRNVAGIPPP